MHSKEASGKAGQGLAFSSGHSTLFSRLSRASSLPLNFCNFLSSLLSLLMTRMTLCTLSFLLSPPPIPVTVEVDGGSGSSGGGSGESEGVREIAVYRIAQHRYERMRRSEYRQTRPKNNSLRRWRDACCPWDKLTACMTDSTPVRAFPFQ